MKKFLFLAAAFAFSFAAMSQTSTPGSTMPKPDDIAKFNTSNHDFGKAKQNVPVTYSFEIKNISDKPIVVESATSTCGCTVPEKPEQPIEPGATAKIKVVYNAASLGAIHKEISVKLSGTDQMKVLVLTGEVLTPEAYEVYLKEKANTPPTKNEDKEKPKN
jgi:Protein of unknown function (DUF1573)